ncbi:MAG: hypothetical protein ABW164_06230 [Sphingobium sp.]
MGFREKMQLWVIEALQAMDNEGPINNVAKHIWLNHELDLQQAGEHFFSWQYDMRWAAQKLIDKNKLGLRKNGAKSIWYIR